MADHSASADREPATLPDGLAEIPAGPMLGDLLEGVAVEDVSGFDTVEAVTAWYRQLCRVQARFLQALLETGFRAPYSIATVQRVSSPDEFACEEARAALSWSRSRAQRNLLFALDIFSRLPSLGEAMLAGVLDEPRARAFIDWTEGLTDLQAHQVCEELLPAAGGLTVGELIDRIKRLCVALDPEWAAHRYREAVKRRTVRGFRNPDGTANLGAYNQPVDRIAAASARIDGLARACKRAGDTRPINHVRSDLYLGMTDGAFEGLSEQQIVEYVLTHPYTDPGSPPDPSAGPPTSPPPPSPPPSDPGPDSPPDTLPRRPSGQPPGSTPQAPPDPTPPDPTPPSAPGDAELASLAQRDPRRSWAVPELRIRLSTALGQDEYPAEIPAWDYIPAELARHLLQGMHDAEWRYVLCDPDDGRAISGGLLRSRPHRQGGTDARRGGIVEIAVTAADLDNLRPPKSGDATYETFAPVMAELLEVKRDGRPTSGDDPRRRAAGARLRRWIQLRDRVCVHPACRAPAASADQDHRIGYAIGGPTTDVNLESVCRHDHRVKDEGGWTVELIGSDETQWLSPLGHRYRSRPPPVIIRLPEPSPDPDREPLVGVIFGEPVPSGRCHRDCGCLDQCRQSTGCVCGCAEPIFDRSP